MQTCFLVFFHSHDSNPFFFLFWCVFCFCSQLCNPLYLPLQILTPSHSGVSRLVSCQSPLLALSPCSFSLLPLQWRHQLQPQPAGTSCGFEEISHSVQLLVKAWHSNYDSSHLLRYMVEIHHTSLLNLILMVWRLKSGCRTSCGNAARRWSDLREPRSVKKSHHGACAENKRFKKM